MWWQVGQGCTLSFPPLSHAWLLASQESLHPPHPAFPRGGKGGNQAGSTETVGKREVLRAGFLRPRFEVEAGAGGLGLNPSISLTAEKVMLLCT